MADNSAQTGTDTIATDELTTINGGASSGVKVQRVKAGYGDDGTHRDVSDLYPLPVNLTSTSGIDSIITPFGELLIGGFPRIIFGDMFDGTTIDTNKWTAGGSVPPTQPNSGNLLVQPGTAASASSSATGTFAAPLQYMSGFVVEIATEATTMATGNHRFWGLGVQPTTWAAATPIQDGMGVEITTAGVMRAVVYASGVVISSVVLPVHTDTAVHLYQFYTRPGITYLVRDSAAGPLATLPGATNTQSLPFRLHSINGAATTTGTPLMSAAGLGILDTGGHITQLGDGTYPWRKAKVGTDGGLIVSGAPVSTGNITSAALSLSSFTVLAANVNRDMATIFNDSNNVLYVALAATCSVTVYTVQIQPGGYYELPGATGVYNGVVTGIALVASGSARVTEMT